MCSQIGDETRRAHNSSTNVLNWTLWRTATLFGHRKQVSNSTDGANCVVGRCRFCCFRFVLDCWNHFGRALLAPLPSATCQPASSSSYPANCGCQNNRESRNLLASEDAQLCSLRSKHSEAFGCRVRCDGRQLGKCGELSISPEAPLKSSEASFWIRQLSAAD